MQLTRSLEMERAQRDVAVQQALAQVRAEMETVTVVSANDKVAYTMNWAQQPTEATNQQAIEGMMVTGKLKDNNT